MGHWNCHAWQSHNCYTFALASCLFRACWHNKGAIITPFCFTLFKFSFLVNSSNCLCLVLPHRHKPQLVIIFQFVFELSHLDDLEEMLQLICHWLLAQLVGWQPSTVAVWSAGEGRKFSSDEGGLDLRQLGYESSMAGHLGSLGEKHREKPSNHNLDGGSMWVYKSDMSTWWDIRNINGIQLVTICFSWMNPSIDYRPVWIFCFPRSP